MLSKAHRISKQSDFAEIYQSRKVVANGCFRANFDFKAGNGPLVAAVASKKVGKANIRNKIRRAVKSAFKEHNLLTSESLRIIITAKPTVTELDAIEIKQSVNELLDKIRV